MSIVSETSPHLKTLSEHLLRHVPVASWRKLFLGPAAQAIRFERRVLTLLYADALSHGWTASEVAMLAGRFQGQGELCGPGAVLFSFEHPLPALRAALLLQKIGADTGVSAGLTTGICTVAVFELDGEMRRMVLPPEAARAETRARQAPPATIVISPETYELLEPLLADEVRDGLVTAECEGERVVQVSITLAPPANADLSTFAGLGMR